MFYLCVFSVKFEELSVNPVLDFPDSVLSEEDQSVAMVTGGEDEEGAVSDLGSEIVDGASEKMKVLNHL